MNCSLEAHAGPAHAEERRGQERAERRQGRIESSLEFALRVDEDCAERALGKRMLGAPIAVLSMSISKPSMSRQRRESPRERISRGLVEGRGEDD